MTKMDTPTTSKTSEVESTDFFETMPMTAGHFVFRDDTIELEDKNHDDLAHEIKATAIITLVLVLVTAVALSLLVWRGLDTIRGTVSPTADATSLEL
ncbi:MAG: hypothetical protein ABIS59_00850 [Candidatus Saccharibacteria bacterium]